MILAIKTRRRAMIEIARILIESEILRQKNETDAATQPGEPATEPDDVE